MPDYVYRGDKMTAPERRGARCSAVRRADGRCVRGRNGSMLVRFEDGALVVVLGRQLRKLATPNSQLPTQNQPAASAAP